MSYEALRHYGCPEIFNTDQGSQFTSEDFTSVLRDRGIKISMDGRGRCIDNVFVERLWRSLKYEEIYIKDYDTVTEARHGIGRYFDFFNDKRPHQALGYQMPSSFYGVNGYIQNHPGERGMIEPAKTNWHSFRLFQVKRTVCIIALALSLMACSFDADSKNKSDSSEFDIVQVSKVMSTAVTELKKYLESHGDELDAETFRKKYRIMLKKINAVASSPIREFLCDVHVMTSELQWYSYLFHTESKRFGKLVPIDVGSIRSKDQLEALSKLSRTYLATLDDYKKAWVNARNKARELRNRDGIDQKIKDVFLSGPHFNHDTKNPPLERMYNVLRDLAKLTNEQSQLLMKHWGRWEWNEDDQELRIDEKQVEKHHKEIVLRLQDVKRRIDARHHH